MFNIQVPNEYTGETVLIKIKKPNGYNFTGVYNVEDGIVQIDVIQEMPQGFLNAWGGPYTLQFIDPDSNSIVWFVVDGEEVQGIEWNMDFGTGQEICGLDIYA